MSVMPLAVYAKSGAIVADPSTENRRNRKVARRKKPTVPIRLHAE
jgi:hypothetical protein